MRLNKNQKNIIKSIVINYINNYKIYIFGSRLDDDKKGGDIDLLIKTTEAIPLKTILLLKINLENKLTLPIDIINYHKNEKSNFKKLAYAQAIQI